MASSDVYNVFKDLKVAAGAEETLVIVGSFVQVLDANQGFKVGLDRSPTQFIQAGLGISAEQGERFKTLTIDNSENAAELTVTVAVGTGRLRDSRLSLTGDISTATPTSLSSADDVHLPANTASPILLSNASRKEAIITNPKTNSLLIRIGDSHVGAARGMELHPGQTLILGTEAEIWGYSASDQNVGVLEVLA